MPNSRVFWNKRSKKYDAKLPAKGPNYAARLGRAAAVLTPTSRVLDVGCATGEITLDLAARCGQIMGVDTAEDMIALATGKAEQRGIKNARFAAIDPADASIEPGGFDAITCYSVFHLADDYRAMLRRFAELLKPGGHLLNETPCLGDWGPHWKLVIKGAVLIGVAPRIVSIRVAELEQAMRDVGLEVLDSAMHNPKSGQHCVLARKPMSR